LRKSKTSAMRMMKRTTPEIRVMSDFSYPVARAP
jgi:hypothetical protein